MPAPPPPAEPPAAPASQPGKERTQQLPRHPGRTTSVSVAPCPQPSARSPTQYRAGLHTHRRYCALCRLILRRRVFPRSLCASLRLLGAAPRHHGCWRPPPSSSPPAPPRSAGVGVSEARGEGAGKAALAAAPALGAQGHSDPGRGEGKGVGMGAGERGTAEEGSAGGGVSREISAAPVPPGDFRLSVALPLGIS